MQYKMIIFTCLSFILVSGCSDKKKETKNVQVTKTIQKEVLVIEKNITSPLITKGNKPFKPTIEANISQENIMTESLEELQSTAFKTIQPKVFDEIQKIPDCLENAETKEEAFACSKKLRELNKEIAMSMGDFSEEGIEAYDKDFIWNEETKINMIQEIEAGTQAMQEMQTCMETSKTPEALEKCLEQ
jgi:hypothetical protein